MSSMWIAEATFALLVSASFAMVNKDDCETMKKIRTDKGYDWKIEANRWVKDPSTNDEFHTCHINIKDAAGPNRQWWGYVLCSYEIEPSKESEPQKKSEPVKCGWGASISVMVAAKNGNEGTILLPVPRNPAGSCHTTGRCECQSRGAYKKGAGLRAVIGPNSLDSNGHAVSDGDKNLQECTDRQKDAKKAAAAMQADPEFPPKG